MTGFTISCRFTGTAEGLPPPRDKWYKHTEMADDQIENPQPEPAGQDADTDQEALPVGIARIREEWLATGFARQSPPEKPEQEPAPVVFDEVDGGAGIGDYTLDPDSVRDMLGLSQDAMQRLIDSGELDSILVRGPDGEPRRMISESSVKRFEEDSAIDPAALKRAARAMADRTIVEAIQELQAEIDELRNTQGRVLQQMKDMLLLEVRNLKEQDRDLASFVYELAEEIRRLFPKRR